MTDSGDMETNNSEPHVQFTVMHNKKRYPIDLPESATVADLKRHLEGQLDVPSDMQKIIFKGMKADDCFLRQLGLTKDTKVMVVGATREAADNVRSQEEAAKSGKIQDDGPKEDAAQPDSWCDQTEHKKVLEKHGKPEDAMVGIINVRDDMPPEPLRGMYDKRGQKVRITVKMDTAELWLSTKDRTQKLPLSTVQKVVSQPIRDHADYHIVAFQLGPTEKSRYFVYWLPAQFVDSLKELVMQFRMFDG